MKKKSLNGRKRGNSARNEARFAHVKPRHIRKKRKNQLHPTRG